MRSLTRSGIFLGCFSFLLTLGCEAVDSSIFLKSDGEDIEGRVASTGHTSDNLLPAGQLITNQYLQSADASHRLFLQTDGNLVLKRMSDPKALWASGTNGKSATRFKFQSDGNLVLSTNAGVAVWSSKTAGSGATKLQLHNSGELVLYRNTTVVWSANVANSTDVTIGIQEAKVEWVDHFFNTKHEVTTLKNGATMFHIANAENLWIGPIAAFSKNISVFSVNVDGHYRLRYHNGTSIFDVPDSSSSDPFVSGTKMVWANFNLVMYYDTATPSVPVKSISFDGPWNNLEGAQISGSNFVSVGVVNDYFPNGGQKVVFSNGVTSKTLDTFFNNGYASPSLYGNRIAWSAKLDANINSDTEILVYNISKGTKKQITANAVSDESPSVSDVLIAWISGGTNVYVYKNENGPAQKIAQTYSFSRITGLKVFNEKAVWEATVGSGPSHIYFYDGSAVTALSAVDVYNNLRLCSISANTVVYTGSKGVYSYSIPSKTTRLVYSTAKPDEIARLSVH